MVPLTQLWNISLRGCDTVNYLLFLHNLFPPSGVCILIAATVGLWFAAGTVRNGMTGEDPCVGTLQDHSIYLTYNDYLGFAGILVIMLIFAIAISVGVVLGLSVDSLPAAAKILAAACCLVPVVALLLFLLWLGLGTAMAVYCPSNARALIYIGLMWLYFLIVLAVGIIAVLLMARTAKRAVQKALH